jgi:DNA-3-methyladenine glycosylase
MTDGPAKLCQALAVDRRLDGHDLCAPAAVLFVERSQQVPTRNVTRGPRVGLNGVPEPWIGKPWRFQVTAAGIDRMEDAYDGTP